MGRPKKCDRDGGVVYDQWADHREYVWPRRVWCRRVWFRDEPNDNGGNESYLEIDNVLKNLVYNKLIGKGDVATARELLLRGDRLYTRHCFFELAEGIE